MNVRLLTELKYNFKRRIFVYMLFRMLFCVCRQQKRVGEQEEHGVKSKLPFNNHKYLHLVNSVPD